MSVFNALNEKRDSERQKAFARYFTLLDSMDINKPTQTHKTELAKCMEELKKLPRDAEADYSAVQEARKVEALAQEYDQRMTVMDEARQVHEATAKKAQKAIKEQQELLHEAFLTSDEASRKFQTSDRARKDLKKHKEEHPDLWNALGSNEGKST